MQLPMQATLLLPHKGPMCCIDTLVTCAEEQATAQVSLHSNYIFMHGNTLEPAAYIELAAQTAGAMMGYHSLVKHTPVAEGFLVGAQNFVVHHRAKVNDILTIAVSIISEFEQITTLDTQVYKNAVLYAQGAIKVYLPYLITAKA